MGEISIPVSSVFGKSPHAWIKAKLPLGQNREIPNSFSKGTAMNLIVSVFGGQVTLAYDSDTGKTVGPGSRIFNVSHPILGLPGKFAVGSISDTKIASMRRETPHHIEHKNREMPIDEIFHGLEIGSLRIA